MHFAWIIAIFALATVRSVAVGAVGIQRYRGRKVRTTQSIMLPNGKDFLRNAGKTESATENNYHAARVLCHGHLEKVKTRCKRPRCRRVTACRGKPHGLKDQVNPGICMQITGCSPGCRNDKREG